MESVGGRCNHGILSADLEGVHLSGQTRRKVDSMSLSEFGPTDGGGKLAPAEARAFFGWEELY